MTVDLVVTGAGGYLGSYLTRSAARRGYHVRGLVRHAVPWMELEQQRIVRLSSDIDVAIEGAEVLVHLAAPNETAFGLDPEEAHRQTVEVSRSVARACARTGVRRLIYVSTVHVYGSNLRPGASITEETPASPVNNYGRSRFESENIVNEEAQGVQVVTLRLTNGIGPPVSPLVQRWTLVTNDLCRQACDTGRIRLVQPDQWRDFIPLDAVMSVILDASDPAHEQLLAPGIYNLSAGRSRTILDLANLIVHEAREMEIPVAIEAPIVAPGLPYVIDPEKLRDTGLLPNDLSLSGAIRDTLQLCVRAKQSVRREAPLGE